MSTFALKRGYELQLPMSFVDVDRDEMEYVDGGSGFSNWFFYVDNVGAIINTVIGSVLPLGGITAFFAKKGVANAARYLQGFIVNKLKSIGLTVAGGTIFYGIQWAVNYFNPGLRFAKLIDSVDKSPNNGICW